MDTSRLAELAVMWADGELDQAQWRAARSRLDQRLAGTRAAFARMRGTTVVDQWVGNGSELQQRWTGLNLGRQTAVVRAVIDHLVIRPAAQRGRRSLDPGRVAPVWRL